jgi:hypothetical protein
VKNLLYTLVLICICFVESNGGIENNISYNVAPADSSFNTVIYEWDSTITDTDKQYINYFAANSDSSWVESVEGLKETYYIDSDYDSIAVIGKWFDGTLEYQFLIWTEE